MPSSPLSAIEHIVVLMLENRSFDSLLGFHDPRNKNAPFNGLPPANFEGVYGKDLSNPAPPLKGRIPSPEARPPAPTLTPASRIRTFTARSSECRALPGAGRGAARALDSRRHAGFRHNYAAQAEVARRHRSWSIMNCLTPDTVPVLSSLAYYYGLCDHWFSSVPTQTLLQSLVRRRRHLVRLR
jgi:phospholipase C